MNILKLEYNKITYNLHIVDDMNYSSYSSLLNNINICDPRFLDSSYELLSYLSVQDNNCVGFFLSNDSNTIIYSSAIIDLDCNKNKDEIIDNGYQISESIEITLLCSNYRQRIIGLTKYFMEYIITNLIQIYKSDVKHIFLHVGKGIEFNRNAYEFYIKFGFKPLTNNINNTNNADILIYSLSGGKHRYKNKNKHMHTYKKKKSKSKSKSKSKKYNKSKSNKLRNM